LQSYVLAKSIYIVNMFAKVQKIIQYTILCILLPYVIIGFQKATSYQNLTKNLVCYWKSSLSGSVPRLVVPGFWPKGRVMSFQEKSENVNSLRPNIF